MMTLSTNQTYTFTVPDQLDNLADEIDSTYLQPLVVGHTKPVRVSKAVFTNTRKALNELLLVTRQKGHLLTTAQTDLVRKIYQEVGIAERENYW